MSGGAEYSMLVKSVERVKPYYIATLKGIGLDLVSEKGSSIVFGHAGNLVLEVHDSTESRSTDSDHVIFRVGTADIVRLFLITGLAKGGRDFLGNGVQTKFDAFLHAAVTDVDENTIEAVFQLSDA